MVTPKAIVLISTMLDKMDINIETLTGPSQEEVALKLVGMISRRLYKAEKEFYGILAEYKDISVEEAQKVDFVVTFKEMMSEAGIKSIFTIPAR